MMECVFIVLAIIIAFLAIVFIAGAKIEFEFSCADGGLALYCSVKLAWGLMRVRFQCVAYKGMNGYRLNLKSTVFDLDSSIKRIKLHKKRKKNRKKRFPIKKGIKFESISGEIGLDNAAVLAILCGQVEAILAALSEILQADTIVRIRPMFGSKKFILKLAGIVRLSPMHIIFAKLITKRRKRQCPIQSRTL